MLHSTLPHVAGALQNGGTRQHENHLAFETMLTSVIPEDADELGLVTFLSNLLEVDRKAVRRCIQRGRDTFGYHGFVSVLHLPRAVRWNSIVYGRLVAREFWHAMCRLDTRPGAPHLHTTTMHMLISTIRTSSLCAPCLNPARIDPSRAGFIRFGIS